MRKCGRCKRDLDGSEFRLGSEGLIVDSTVTIVMDDGHRGELMWTPHAVERAPDGGGSNEQ